MLVLAQQLHDIVVVFGVLAIKVQDMVKLAVRFIAHQPHKCLRHRGGEVVPNIGRLGGNIVVELIHPFLKNLLE